MACFSWGQRYRRSSSGSNSSSSSCSGRTSPTKVAQATAYEAERRAKEAYRSAASIAGREEARLRRDQELEALPTLTRTTFGHPTAYVPKRPHGT